MEKKVVCPVDGRKFNTRAALNQHRADAHPSSKSRPKYRPRGSSKGSKAGELSQVVVAQPQRVFGAGSGDRALVSGTDRLIHIPNVAVFKHGQVVLDFLVTPSSFKRLSKLSSVFQHIEYKSLVFMVEPQVSAAVNGGYVCGFVGDPADDIVSLDQITSTRGSVTTKWWQSSKVNADFVRKKYYTAVGPDPREYSPGRFGIISDGAANQPSPLSVFCQWSVVCSGSVMEPPPPTQLTLVRDVWIRNGHQGVFAHIGDGDDDKDFSSKITDLIKEAKIGSWYRLPYPVTLIKPNDGVLAAHHWLYVRDATSMFLAANSPTDWYEAAYTVNNLVLNKGDLVNWYKPAQGEADTASLQIMAPIPENTSEIETKNSINELIQSLNSQLSRLSSLVESRRSSNTSEFQLLQDPLDYMERS